MKLNKSIFRGQQQ